MSHTRRRVKYYYENFYLTLEKADSEGSTLYFPKINNFSTMSSYCLDMKLSRSQTIMKDLAENKATINLFYTS